MIHDDGSANGAMLYAAVGAELAPYALEAASGHLTRGAAISLPAAVQYAWAHPRAPFLYVAFSDRAAGRPGSAHGLAAFRVDPGTGALRPHGVPVPLATRPIHLTLTGDGRFLLTAYNDPSGLTVHRIGPDGAIGPSVPQAPDLRFGTFGHQVRVAPGDRSAILVARGNDAAGERPEDPGSLRVFALADGVLTPVQTVAPGGGYGFGPRHLDFHPTKPWAFVSLERQNRLQVFALEGDRLSDAPLHDASTLADPADPAPQQLAGAVRIHPDGRHAYVANRPDWVAEENGRTVHRGGENSIAVFRIDEDTGAPIPAGRAEPRGYHARTFSLDPEGRVLVAASIRPRLLRGAGGGEAVPAALTVFRVRADGTLDLVRAHDVEVGGAMLFWAGFVPLR